MRHVGLGDLLERLERLRQTAHGRGALRRLPQAAAAVPARAASASSPARTRDAEKDVLRNAQLRWPAVRVPRRPRRGAGRPRGRRGDRARSRRSTRTPRSTSSSSRAAAATSRTCSPSATRRCVRAAAACRTPIVSAIGHEADRPLLDDVADLRASTPTDAAKRVVPDVADELARVQQARAGIRCRVTAADHRRGRPPRAAAHAARARGSRLDHRQPRRRARPVRRARRANSSSARSSASRTASPNSRAQLRALSPQAHARPRLRDRAARRRAACCARRPTRRLARDSLLTVAVGTLATTVDEP